MGLQIVVLPHIIILTTDGSHLNVNQRETETGDPLIILLSIYITISREIKEKLFQKSYQIFFPKKLCWTVQLCRLIWAFAFDISFNPLKAGDP